MWKVRRLAIPYIKNIVVIYITLRKLSPPYARVTSSIILFPSKNTFSPFIFFLSFSFSSFISFFNFFLSALSPIFLSSLLSLLFLSPLPSLFLSLVHTPTNKTHTPCSMTQVPGLMRVPQLDPSFKIDSSSSLGKGIAELSFSDASSGIDASSSVWCEFLSCHISISRSIYFLLKNILSPFLSLSIENTLLL